MDSTLFYIALFVHLSSLILGFGSVLVIDTFGLLWLLKKQPLSQALKVAEITQRLIWIGWGGMAASGLALILMKGYLDNLTKIKLFFVLMVGLNGIFLHYVKKSLEGLSDRQKVPRVYLFRMSLATVISQTGWWGAILIGFVHRHIEHNIAWPNNPYAYMLAIAAVFGLVAVMGEKILKNSKYQITNFK